MYREQVPQKQMGTWVATFSPVAIYFAAKVGWGNVALAAVIGVLSTWLTWRWGRFGRWTVIPACILLVLYVGQILKCAASVWMGNSYPAVPLMLLALALWSSLKGASAAVRVGCILFGVVLFVYPVVYGAAIQDVRWEWMQPNNEHDYNVLILSLLPTLSAILLKGENSICKKLLLPGVLAVVGSLITAGILSPVQNGGLYQMARSIDLFGGVKHLEPLVSIASTVGWFTLISWSLTICGGAGEIIIGNGKIFSIVGALAMASLMLCEMHIHSEILAVLTAVFWVLVPILAQGLERVKKHEKSKIDS